MNPFLVKLDENLGNAHLQLLRGSGYDADTVLGERLSGSTDEFLWSKVVADGRFLVTLDLDFSDIRRFRPGTHPGILLVRARSTSRFAVLEVLRRVLSGRPLEDLRRRRGSCTPRRSARWRAAQEQVAKRVGSSQSLVAKMEAGEPAVTMDLLVGTLLRLGARPQVVSETIEAAILAASSAAKAAKSTSKRASRSIRAGHGQAHAKTA